MSGIEKMSEKIKRKMTLDDLPSPELTKSSVEIKSHRNEPIESHQSTTMNEFSAKDVTQTYISNDQVASVQQYSKPAKQGKVSYGKKVTLYLTEDHFKIFNDIYAQRMLDGRKTDKSTLICEAIGLLKQNETLAEKQSH
jgi:hypothetical protein